MKIFTKFFKKNDVGGEDIKKTGIDVHEVRKETDHVPEAKADAPKEDKEAKSLDAVAPREVGKLDMVIAFDTTGSMAAYIEAVRKEVSDLIPRLFRDNPDLFYSFRPLGDTEKT